MGTTAASIQLTIANVAEHAGGGVGGNPQWGGQFNLTGSHADLAVPHLDVDDLFVIDPRFQFFLGDAQLDGVPSVFLENVDVAGFVLGGVEVIDAGNADAWNALAELQHRFGDLSAARVSIESSIAIYPAKLKFFIVLVNIF